MTGSKKDELKRREHSNRAAKKSFISSFASIKARSLGGSGVKRGGGACMGIYNTKAINKV